MGEIFYITMHSIITTMEPNEEREKMSGNKWKILTAFLVVIIIIQALFISHYKEEADKNYERLERLLLWSMGEHFGQLVHPVVFESYSYPYPITPERAKELKLQNLTEENVDAFLFELYYRSGGGRPINRYDFCLVADGLTGKWGKIIPFRLLTEEI